MKKVAKIPGRPSSRETVPFNVRPTAPDIAIARAVARNTEAAPEAIARALTWGADEKSSPRSSGRRLDRLARTATGRATGRQPCAPRHGSGNAFAARSQVDIRSDPPGSNDRDGPHSWRFVFRQAQRCFPFRARAAHGSAGFRCRNLACPTSHNDPSRRSRAFADEGRRAGALGERRGRGLRSGGRTSNASCGFGQDIRSRLQRRAIVMSHLEESPVSTFWMRTRLK